MVETKKKKTTSSKTTKKPAAKASSKEKKETKHLETPEGAEARPAPKAKKPKGSVAEVKRRPLVQGTVFAKQNENPGTWVLIDASGQPLGRLSTRIAQILMGKHKPTYTRHADTGDSVVVINAKHVVLTGNKLQAKVYHYHTNYPGGIKTLKASELMEKTPEKLIERAVYGMLPKGHMGRRWYGKLRVFAGAEHPHQAQKPQAFASDK